MARANPGADGADTLRDARETDRLRPYLGATWQRRHYIWYVARSELRSRQINSILGNLWHLLNPLLQISVFFLFFGLILDVTRGVDNFLGFLSVGIFVYSYTQRAAMSGGSSLIKYSGLMKIVSFPRATLPITTSITEGLAIVPAYALMLVVAVVTGEQPAVSWLLIIPFGLLQTLFNTGVGLVVARAVNHIPDVQQVLPFVFRLGFYASGVIFNVGAYLEDSEYRVLFELNPMYCFIEMYRAVLLEGSRFDLSLFVTACVWTVAALIGGFVWFRRAEDAYGQR